MKEFSLDIDNHTNYDTEIHGNGIMSLGIEHISLSIIPDSWKVSAIL